MRQTSQPSTNDGPRPPTTTKPRPLPGAVLGPPPPELAVAREARDATTLSMLARHHDPRVRMAVGRNPETPEEALQALAGDQEPDVLEAVASNPALPDALFAELYERTPTQGTKVIPALLNNGPRGAYVGASASVARLLLYFFGGLFTITNTFAFTFGGKSGSRTIPALNPITLQTLVVAAGGFVLARALYPVQFISAAKLRARSVWPTVAMWIARAALVVVLAAQVRGCVLL